LRHRVHIAEDTAMSALAPRLRPARVTLSLTDGRRVTHERQSHRGDFDEPFTEAEIRGKFRQLAGTILPPDTVAQAETVIGQIEEWKGVGELTQALRGTT